jgi:hypothetical protein
LRIQDEKLGLLESFILEILTEWFRHNVTGAWVTVWRAGVGDEETTVVALGAGGAWAWEEEKESGRRCGGGWHGSPIL